MSDSSRGTPAPQATIEQALDPGGDPVKELRRGWWQRVKRTPKGWALSVSNDSWVEVEGGEPVIVIEKWHAKPHAASQDHVIIISPSRGFLLVAATALS